MRVDEAHCLVFSKRDPVRQGSAKFVKKTQFRIREYPENQPVTLPGTLSARNEPVRSTFTGSRVTSNAYYTVKRVTLIIQTTYLDDVLTGISDFW